MIRKNKPKQKVSYWCIAYLITYNKLQIRYTPFKKLEDIFNNKTINCYQNDYILRITSNGVPFIYYTFNKKKWDKLPEVIEYDQNIIQDLKYLQ